MRHAAFATFRSPPGPLRSPASRLGVGLVLAIVLAMVLAGCASGPRVGDGASRGSAVPHGADRADRDGPPLDYPADLASRPDAEPRLETVRSGGPNKPYQVFGRDYLPFTRDAPFVERGLASWYGRKFHGRPTSNGETYDMYAMTAAHPTLPIPSYARIRNPANGREVVVRVNDRGPFHPGRIVDLSYAAAARLDLLRRVAVVELERITFESIRAGTWRQRTDDEPTRLAGMPAADNGAVVVDVGGAALTPIAASTTEASSARAAVVPSVATSAGYWIQLGAFRERAAAESLQRRVAPDLEALLPGLATVQEAALFRVRAGPFANRELARDAAERVRDALGFPALVVERR